MATTQFRGQTVTQRESWILANLDSGITSVVDNCKNIEPGRFTMTGACTCFRLSPCHHMLDSIMLVARFVLLSGWQATT